MNPELLRSFLAVAHRLSFTRAADDLTMTQPGVSRQIGQLERELGVVLFERLGRSVQLTDAGRALVPLAEQLLGQIERSVEAVRCYASADRGSLRIGASTTPGYYWLPPVLGAFHKRHPGVELHLVVANTREIEQRIHRNELDLGFVGGHLTSDTLRTEHVADDEIVCISGPHHPLGRGGTATASRSRGATVAALNRATWIVRERGSATRALFEQQLAKVGVHLEHVIELDSPEGIKALVAAGIGVSFLSIHAVRAELRRRELRQVHLPGLRLARPLYLVRHPDKHVSIAMQSLLDLLPRRGG